MQDFEKCPPWCREHGSEFYQLHMLLQRAVVETVLEHDQASHVALLVDLVLRMEDEYREWYGPEIA